MRAKLFLFLLSAATLLAQCGKKKESDSRRDPNSADFVQADGLGCVQGTVINGLTGQKISLPKEEGLGVFVLIRGVKFRASIVQNPEDESESELAGEYFVCNVPLDESYLLFAQYNNFLPFQSEVRIASTALSAGENDIQKPDPMLLANIRLFPKGTETTDLRLTVVNDAKPLKGGRVLIEPSGSNAFDKSGFLPPSSSRLVPIPELVTNDDGQVQVNKDLLVLGATYTYRVIPPSGTNLKVAEGSFVLGITTSGNASANHYEFTVNLATAAQPLALVSCSNREVSYSPDGKISYTLNRDVELVDLDDPIASVADVGTYGGNDIVDSVELNPHADDNNDASEQVKVEISGNMVTLSPRFTAEKRKPDPKKDPGLFITYDSKSIKFRIKPGEAADTQGPVPLESLLADAKCSSDVYFFPYIGVPKE
jgi:hypothetical protein